MGNDSDVVYSLVSEISFLIFCAFGVCADVAIFGTITRFKRLRSTGSNALMANWAAADILCLLVTPTAYDASALFHGKSKNKKLLFAVFKMGVAFHMTVVLCVLMLTLDWMLVAYHQKLRDKLAGYYKYAIGLMWISSVASSYMYATTCNSYKCVLHEPELIIAYCLLTFFVLVAQLYRCVRTSQHPALALNLATVFVFTWLLGFANLVYVRWIVKHPLVSTFLNCVTFSTSIVNFLAMYIFDDDYYACLTVVCNKSDKKYAVAPF